LLWVSGFEVKAIAADNGENDIFSGVGSNGGDLAVLAIYSHLKACSTRGVNRVF
jgi:hypothetical protein